MSHLPRELLNHILQESEYLIRDSSRLSEEGFMEYETRKRAYSRSLEIIGEASKRIDEETKQRLASVEWTAMARMRDRLIHHYFGVDYELVWDTVKNAVPRLHAEVVQALAEPDERGNSE